MSKKKVQKPLAVPTEKQEGFAFDVGYRQMNYTEAYKNNYSCENSNQNTIYKRAHEVSKHPNVVTRTKYWSNQRTLEAREAFKWSIRDSEKELRALLTKNKNDLVRAEKNGRKASMTSNDAIINAIEALDNLRREVEGHDRSEQMADAELKNMVKKGQLLDDSSDQGDTTVIELKL